MATTFSISIFFFFSLFLLSSVIIGVSGGNWCVARSDASVQALQSAIDYACSAGADCTPILSNGLCFLPNTIQAHASYAFNSYFQRKSMAPGSCDFSGTATLAKTDPSYGSCVYPSSLSTAGGATTPSTSTNNGTSTTPMPTTLTPANGDGTAGLNPGMTPPLPTGEDDGSLGLVATTLLMPFSLLIVFLLTL
ncbi:PLASMODESMATA CALLOSE-BINDING PROTEIN 3 [Euphorbia lathyris]|uniref:PLASMODESMATA CALLOSE-BINDING PROTEIN 3 n=1 Tax=Euphorbia lathyris TaxID=212925 RepID=UPI0033132789